MVSAVRFRPYPPLQISTLSPDPKIYLERDLWRGIVFVKETSTGAILNEFWGHADPTFYSPTHRDRYRGLIHAIFLDNSRVVSGGNDRILRFWK
jgi:hypothetical protein